MSFFEELKRRNVIRIAIAYGITAWFILQLSDVVLDNTNPQIEKMPPDASDPFLREVYAGISTFVRIHVSPMLVLDQAAEE